MEDIKPVHQQAFTQRVWGGDNVSREEEKKEILTEVG